MRVETSRASVSWTRCGGADNSLLPDGGQRLVHLLAHAQPLRLPAERQILAPDPKTWTRDRIGCFAWLSRLSRLVSDMGPVISPFIYYFSYLVVDPFVTRRRADYFLSRRLYSRRSPVSYPSYPSPAFHTRRDFHIGANTLNAALLSKRSALI